MIVASLLLSALTGVESPAIRVDDVSIPAIAVTARAAELMGRGFRGSHTDLARGIVDETLLALDAKRSGLANNPDVKSAVARARTQVLADEFLEHEVSESVKPSDETLRALYHSRADYIRLNLLVLETEAEARAARARIEQGGEFALEAAKSLDPSSQAARGDTGMLMRAQLPEKTADALFKAAIGDMVGPVPWGPGWGVAQVVQKKVGDEAGFASQREALRKRAVSMAVNQAKQHFLGILRGREKITIDEQFLEKLGTRIAPKGDEADHVLAVVRGVPIRYRDVLPMISEVASSRDVSHRSTAAVKSQLVSQYVDLRLLSALAIERGLDKSANVSALVAMAENKTLAQFAIAAIASGKSKTEEQKKALNDRVAALRSKAKVEIDDARVRAALETLQ